MKNGDRVLLTVTALAAAALVVFQDARSLLPLSTGDFVFLSAILFAFALYRPGWAYLLFIGFLPLETVDLAPLGAGLHLRPYQLTAALIVAALVVRSLSGRLRVPLMRWHWADACVALTLMGGAVASAFSPRPETAIKQAVVLWSFGLLYFLTRYFVRSVRDLYRTAPFVLVPAVLVSVYALWQNVRFAHGLENFAVMVGRPNATLTEPDWLGMFLLPALALAFGWFHGAWTRLWGTDTMNRLAQVWHRMTTERRSVLALAQAVAAWVTAMVLVMALVVTVSRSAWLGAAAMTGVLLLSYLWRTGRPVREWPWRLTAFEALKVAAAYAVALGAVVGLHLTTFPLFERAQSTGGWQKITVACAASDTLPPARIGSVDELLVYRCRHIDLEAIDMERDRGASILTVERPDPNTGVRASIYARVTDILGRSWLTGIGWGSVGAFLGSDERGADLNASNVFLEVWLGSGLVGFLAFTTLWAWVLWRAVCLVFTVTDPADPRVALARFFVATGMGLTVFDMFNSGILLGFVWVWLAAGVALFRKRTRNP